MKQNKIKFASRSRVSIWINKSITYNYIIMEQINKYLQQLSDMAVAYFPKLFLAVLVLVIGWWLINRVTSVVGKMFDKLEKAQELKTFLSSIVEIGLKVLLIISVAGIVGIETTSFVGIIAAMGFAVGLALQGNLSNFAAGVLILLMRPFKVGDEVKIEDYWAHVKEIQIFHTILKAFDHTEIILPNSLIMGGTIENLSATPVRRVFMTIFIPYSENWDNIQKIVTEAAFSMDEIDSDSEPFFWIKGHETHYTEVAIGFETNQKNYWATELKLNKVVLEALTRHQVTVAYPEGIAFSEYGSKELISSE